MASFLKRGRSHIAVKTIGTTMSNTINVSLVKFVEAFFHTKKALSTANNDLDLDKNSNPKVGFLPGWGHHLWLISTYDSER